MKWGLEDGAKRGSAYGFACTAVLLLALTAGLFARGAAAAPVARGNPFVGATLFVDPYSSAQRQVDAWRSGRPEDAAMLEKIASQSTADWFTGRGGPVEARVRSRTIQIVQAGALPVFVAQNAPESCSRKNAVTRQEQIAYRRWVNGFIRGLGSNRAVVILEPNGLTRLHCLPKARQATHLALLRYAVTRFASRSRVTVYLDAGHSRWRPVKEIASALRRAGVARIRGFSLNVAQYGSTPDELAYGQRLSRQLKGKSFVIDVGRNGVGPLTGNQLKRPVDLWCNLGGRALGSPPSTTTGRPRVDAYLWVKRPGESDGTCNGGPHAGSWWPAYALGLAQRASY